MGTRLAGVACLLFLLLLRAPVPGAWAARPDEDQAVAVLRAALDARRGRAPDEALVGLRQLRDPALRPLFASLASGAEPALRRHGVLGLAELESPARINTLMLSRTQDAAELAALLGEALALDLIGTEQIEGILSWPGLDPVVEIILRGRLLAEGRPADEKRLEALAGAGGPMTQILGALVLSAAGKPGRLPEAIDRLRAAEEPERGLVSGRLLEFIRRERTPGSGPLLGALAEMYADQPPLLADILRTWLRIDPAGAAPVWQRAWAASGELSNRLRLAMGALAAADRLPPAFFEAMREGVEDPLLLAMARAGGALSGGSADPDELAPLIGLRYRPAELWVCAEAAGWPSPLADGARRAVIEATAGRSRLSEPVSDGVPIAAEALAASDPVWLESALERARRRNDARLCQALLVGMLRARAAPLWRMDDEPRWPDDASAALATLVAARADADWGKSPERMRRLAELAEGTTGRLPRAIRVQAAWLHIRHSGGAEEALARLLSPG